MRRTQHTLEPLLSQGLIQETDGEGTRMVSITDQGLAKVAEIEDKTAAWHRNLVGDLRPSASELRVLETFTENVHAGIEKQLKTWVFGQAGL